MDGERICNQPNGIGIWDQANKELGKKNALLAAGIGVAIKIACFWSASKDLK